MIETKTIKTHKLNTSGLHSYINTTKSYHKDAQQNTDLNESIEKTSAYLLEDIEQASSLKYVSPSLSGNIYYPNTKNYGSTSVRTEERKSLPGDKEWTNSIYTYNKNTVKSLPATDKIVNKLIKSYFNLSILKNNKKSKRVEIRFKRLSLNRILVSKSEIKHSNNKATITVYVYNKSRNLLYNALNKTHKEILSNKKEKKPVKAKKNLNLKKITLVAKKIKASIQKEKLISFYYKNSNFATPNLSQSKSNISTGPLTEKEVNKEKAEISESKPNSYFVIFPKLTNTSAKYTNSSLNLMRKPEVSGLNRKSYGTKQYNVRLVKGVSNNKPFLKNKGKTNKNKRNKKRTIEKKPNASYLKLFHKLNSKYMNLFMVNMYLQSPSVKTVSSKLEILPENGNSKERVTSYYKLLREGKERKILLNKLYSVISMSPLPSFSYSREEGEVQARKDYLGSANEKSLSYLTTFSEKYTDNLNNTPSTHYAKETAKKIALKTLIESKIKQNIVHKNSFRYFKSFFFYEIIEFNKAFSLLNTLSSTKIENKAGEENTSYNNQFLLRTVEKFHSLFPIFYKQVRTRENGIFTLDFRSRKNTIGNTRLDSSSLMKKTRFITSKSIFLLKKVRKHRELILKSLKWNKEAFKLFENKYYKSYLNKSYKKLMLYLYYAQMLYINNNKFKNWFMVGLNSVISKIYKKRVEFNIVNLKYLHFNNDIFLESISTKLKNRNNRLLKVLNKAMRMVRLPSLRLYSYGRNMQLVNNTSNGNTLKTYLPISSDTLLPPYVTHQNLKSVQPNDNNIEKSVLKTVKYKVVNGVRIEAAGRLSKRLTASRSVFKFKYRGSLKNIDSSYKNLSSTMSKGYVKSNIQYASIASKTRNGSFGLKGWVSSY